MRALRSRLSGRHDQASLAGALQVSFRVVAVGLVATAAVMVAVAGVTFGMLRPRLDSLTDLTEVLHTTEEGMLGQQGALHAWVVTGDERFLEGDRVGKAQVRAAGERLAGLLGSDRDLDAQLLELRVAQEAWLRGWADLARARPAAADRAGVDAFLTDGNTLFDRFQVAYGRVATEAAAQRDRAHDQQTWALAVGLGAQLGMVLVLFAWSRHRHRRLHSTVVGPLKALLVAMERLAAGDRTPGLVYGGPAEFVQLAHGLERMADALVAEHAVVVQRQAETAAAVDRLSLILELEREITGSLNVRYVAEAVAGAGVAIAGSAAAVVWAVDDDGALIAAHDSRTGHAATGDHALPSDTVSLAARTARVGESDGIRALPMVLGGRVVGVLEVDGGASDDGVRAALETLAVHAGAALEAARLHHLTAELSQVDPLTRLFNRRRFAADLADESARSRRHGRPLAFLMADVDHFKTVNDTLGHQRGDAILREVAEVLINEKRAGDTVYRYGGEEFAVLARETDLRGAVELAERLRSAVEREFAHQRPAVTMSVGAAELPDDGPPDLLVAAADAALYAAKTSGRNRVATDPPPPPPERSDG